MNDKIEVLDFQIRPDAPVPANIRRQPSYSADILAQLAPGAHVTAVDVVQPGGGDTWRLMWLVASGYTGWAWVRDLLVCPAGQDPTRPLTEPFGG